MNKTILSDGDEGVLLIIRDVKSKRQAKPVQATETRSPVHVIYGGANLFRSGTPHKLGQIAVKALESYAPNFVEFAGAMRLKGSETLSAFPKAVADLEKQLKKDPDKVKADNFPAWFAWTIFQRTADKLKAEAIEDLRIDFEDGYGFRPDAEEDADAVSAAKELAESYAAGTITHFSGFRVKSFAPETIDRAKRTLHLFLQTFLAKTGGKIPNNFVVTLPKVSDKKQVKKFCSHLKKIEKKAGLPSGSIKIEIMIETPESLINKKGAVTPRSLVDAAKGRCTSVHFGAYDYTASVGISAAHQHIRHAACNFARQIMLATLAPLGIRLSDSVTTEIPVPIHKGDGLAEAQISENKRAVHAAWRVHFDNVTQSMTEGFYQSWDLHPNQLVARYAAVYSFFLEASDAQGKRLKSFIDKATKANLIGTTFDDAASAQGLLNFFNRALSCGALDEDEVVRSTGLSVEEVRSQSFLKIMANRR